MSLILLSAASWSQMPKGWMLNRHGLSHKMAEGRHTLLQAFCLHHTDEETELSCPPPQGE